MTPILKRILLLHLALLLPACLGVDQPFTGTVTQYRHTREYNRVGVVPRPLPPHRLGKSLKAGQIWFAGSYNRRFPGTLRGRPAEKKTGPAVVVPEWQAGGAIYGAFSDYLELGMHGSFGKVGSAPAKPQSLVQIPARLAEEEIGTLGLGLRFNFLPATSRIHGAVQTEIGLQRLQQTVVMRHTIERVYYYFKEDEFVGTSQGSTTSSEMSHDSAANLPELGIYLQVGGRVWDQLHLTCFGGFNGRAAARRYTSQHWKDCDGPSDICQPLSTSAPDSPSQWHLTFVSVAGLTTMYAWGPLELSLTSYFTLWSAGELGPELTAQGTVAFVY